MHVCGLKDIDVTDIELKIKDKIYAIDAFRLIEDNYKNDEIFFIMGADNFVNIAKWQKANELTKKYRYIVLEREGSNLEKYITGDIKDKVNIIENEKYKSTSSTKFRNMDKESKNIIPNEVLEYIKENNLYKF